MPCFRFCEARTLSYCGITTMRIILATWQMVKKIAVLMRKQNKYEVLKSKRRMGVGTDSKSRKHFSKEEVS